MANVISYPSIEELKAVLPDLHIKRNNLQNGLSALSDSRTELKKSLTSEKPGTQLNYQEIDPLFLLGDHDHLLVLNLALKSPESLKDIQCIGLQKISDFLVNRKYKQPYCHRLEKCNTPHCVKAHNLSSKDIVAFAENVPILMAFLFFRPAVRAKFLPSFARDHFERISRAKHQEVDLNWIINTIKEWSFAPIHETGLTFNPWIFIKPDYSQYYSAKNYFLLIYSSILKAEVKSKCNKSNCGALDCTRVHFNVNKVDQAGSFRWILRLILREANNLFKIHQREDIEKIVINTTARFIKDTSSSYSMISQYVSLLILANLETSYRVQIIHALKSFTEFSDNSSTSKEIEISNDQDVILLSSLDSGRLLESCFSVLQGSSKSHKLLTVSQYGCSIGEAYMKVLLDTFRKHLSKTFVGRLPLGVSRDLVDSLLTEDIPYTMAMHLWLFKTVPCLVIAEELQYMKVKGFRDVEKGTLTVENWKKAAINACNERNSKWLTLMMTPLPKDMVSACESFMPSWIKALSGLVRKNTSNIPQSAKKEFSSSRRRWEDEDIPICPNEEDELTDWRKIIRFLRNYYLVNSFSKNSRETQQHLASLLNYLLHASHQLKHTDYALFDAEFFLFLAYKLFEILQRLCMSNELLLLIGFNDENAPPSSKITGLVRFSTMSAKECEEIASQFESCKTKIAKFLPLEGTYLQKWKYEPQTDTLDKSFAALNI